MSTEKAWTLFVLASGFVFFKNWIQYTGKKRMMIHSRMNKRTNGKYNIWLLLLLPFIVLALTFILFQAT
jgi:hypothetical protein